MKKNISKISWAIAITLILAVFGISGLIFL